MGEVIPFRPKAEINKMCRNCTHWRYKPIAAEHVGVCEHPAVDEYETNSDWYCSEHTLAKNVDL